MAAERSEKFGSLETAYRVRIGWKYETVEHLGLPAYKDLPPLTLPQIYIALRLKETPNSDTSIYVPEALEQHRHLVVLGDPGSGKSTLVQVLAHSFGRMQPTPTSRWLCPRLGVPYLLPVPIILRDYRVRNWDSPEAMLADYISRLDADIRDEVTVEWLMGHLTEGRGILLLDGLDEVGSPEDRKHLRNKVVRPLLKNISKSPAVLTSRVVGYDEIPLSMERIIVARRSRRKRRVIPYEEKSPYLYVAPFNEEDIDKFVTRWYGARERDERERGLKIASLKEALRRKESIRRLASNPQLLTLMALIHRVTADLPSGRARLYDKITEAYLETIPKTRGLRRYEASLEEMKRWLAFIGWQMQNRRKESGQAELFAAKEEVRGWLIEAMEKGTGAEAEADLFLDYVARRSGLLLPRGPDQFAFSHLTFQEYFAAWHLREHLWDWNRLVELCTERVGDPQWHETLVLLFEMLSEFRGAGDRLADALQGYALEHPDTRSATAELFAEILLDEQTSLSLEERHRAAAFTLESACLEYNEKVIEVLKEVPSDTFDVRGWLVEHLTQSSPAELGDGYFLVAADVESDNPDWPAELGQAIIGQEGNAWSENQIYDIALLAGADLQVCAWVVPQLPYPDWLADDYYHGILCLANLRLPELLFIQHNSAIHGLLAQLSAAYAVNRVTLTLPACYLKSHRGRYYDQSPLDSILSRSLLLSEPFPLSQSRLYLLPQPRHSRYQLWSRTRYLSWSRVQCLRTNRGWSYDGSEEGKQFLQASLSPSLDNSVVSPPFPDWLTNTTGLATDVAKTEWLFFCPSCAEEVLEEHVRRLEELTEAEEDWTRLLGLSGLLLLGAGTPERCAERNALVDKGMTQPLEFTFPVEVREATDTGDFREKELSDLLRHIFLHEPGDPWLKPEWFDPSHPAARFFCATPREFFARAAEVLDPEGKTDLAKWRENPSENNLTGE